MQKQPRCVNIDWLEVHCLEPISSPRDPMYFEREGFIVHVREYGTRVYNQMFALCDERDQPYIEIRRDPKSSGLQGIHEINECHIRLANRTCYRDDAALFMQEFIRTHGYTFRRISRIDIALDFERFDSGDYPHAFLQRYIAGSYSKINQANIHAHGVDRWDARDWNSVSWGAPKSDIGTKMYDKTMELYDPIKKVYKKPYICQQWRIAGLVDNSHYCTKTDKEGKQYTPRIWRIEFSIRSSVRGWFAIWLDGKEPVKKRDNSDRVQSIRNTLDVYDSKEKLFVMWASLAQHYFRFKHYEAGQRKDRCRDKDLFDFSGQQLVFKLNKEKMLGPGIEKKPLDSLLHKIIHFRETHFDQDLRNACDVLIKFLQDDTLMADCHNPFSREELMALRIAMSGKADEHHQTYHMILKELREIMQINPRVLPF